LTTRDAILDGALQVMRTRGLARTTTKEIARAAGFSEATLYKLFTDKTDLFLCVLTERLPRVSVVSDGASGLAGASTVADNLLAIVTEVEAFYEASFPIAMSLFSDTELLARQRDAVHARGAGPEVITEGVARYLRAEQARGRVAATAPVSGAAMSLVGACMHQAFLSRFNDDGAVDRDATARQAERFEILATDIVAAVLPALRP
jgi:AcrR family transcriptional regulator